MSDPASPAPDGLHGAFLTHRDALLRFLRARGAGDAAEDLLQELWIKISAARTGPVASPQAYLYRAANMLMIDRYRSTSQAARRDNDWVEANQAQPGEEAAQPSPERVAIGRDLLERVARRLDALGPRAATAFRRHRIDGIGQREVAAELGVSLSTVESDLRAAYRAVAELKEQVDEA